jgi:deoxycytidylate deaminase
MKSLQDNNDEMEMEIETVLHSEENSILMQENNEAETKHANLHCKHNRVSTSFACEQQLCNPNRNLCREDKN